MRTHQTLPELPVIRHIEVQQFMYDDVVSECFIEVEQLGIEIQVPVRGAGGPLVAHRAHGQPVHLHVQLVCPVVCPSFEGTPL